MQQSNRVKIFSRFAQSIRQLISKGTMQNLHQKYYVRQFKIWQIDTPLAINLYVGIVTRTKKNLIDKNEFRWFENELRIFVWALCFYTLSKNIDIGQMNQGDWAFFKNVFPQKPKILFEYQAKNLLKNHNQYKKWVHEEDQLFQQLVKKDDFRLRWSELGKALYIESNQKYFRTSKQCRERWLNHLDPSKLKKYWLESQDFTLIEYVKYYGKKWALISKKLQNKRNEHSIKNRFKSLLTKQSKTFLQPSNEAQLVDNIYYKLLKNTNKDKDEYHQKIIVKESQPQEEIEYFQEESLYGKDPFIDHQEESSKKQSIFDEDDDEDKSSIYQDIVEEAEQKEVLGNISNSSKDYDNKGELKMIPKLSTQNQGSQVFEFTKLDFQNAEHKGDKPQKEGQNEVQKRVRADLFLQEDPFELLRSYFYKESP